MATDQFDDLLKRMPKIADAVNAFKSDEVQASAFKALLDAAGAEAEEDEPTDSEPKKKVTKTAKKKIDKAVTTDDPGDFFAQFEHDKPAENVKLIAGWLYSQHGVIPITNADIQALANDAGITVAGRADLTMKTTKADGKNLFTKQGNGWKLTLAGEKFMKDTYSVRKGNKPRDAQESE
jgi:hypothetical protein